MPNPPVPGTVLPQPAPRTEPVSNADQQAVANARVARAAQEAGLPANVLPANHPLRLKALAEQQKNKLHGTPAPTPKPAPAPAHEPAGFGLIAQDGELKLKATLLTVPVYGALLVAQSKGQVAQVFVPLPAGQGVPPLTEPPTFNVLAQDEELTVRAATLAPLGITLFIAETGADLSLSTAPVPV
jgi:hypothetical protein